MILAPRSRVLEWLRERFCRRAVGYLEPARSEKTLLYLRKRLTIVDRFEGLWSVGARFRL